MARESGQEQFLPRLVWDDDPLRDRPFLIYKYQLMRRTEFNRRLAYQRVVLATYWLSGVNGLCCMATNAEIALEAKVGVESARQHIREMERRGVVKAMGWRDGLNHRKLVLLDHRSAQGFIDRVRSIVRDIGPGCALQRSWKRQPTIHHLNGEVG